MIFILLALFSKPSFSSNVLLECNLSGGDTQQALVLSHNGALELKELTSTGRSVARALSVEEWESGKISLYTKSGTSILSRSVDGWWLEVRDGGFSYKGYADCNP